MPDTATPDKQVPGWWVRGGDVALECHSLRMALRTATLLAPWGWHWRGCLAAEVPPDDGSVRLHIKSIILVHGSCCLCLSGPAGPRRLMVASPQVSKTHGHALVPSLDVEIGLANRKPREGQPAVWVLGDKVGIECHTVEGLLDMAKALKLWGWSWLSGLEADVHRLPAKMFPYYLSLEEAKVPRGLQVYSPGLAKERLCIIRQPNALAAIRDRLGRTSGMRAPADPTPQGCQHLNKRPVPGIGPLDAGYDYCPDCKQEV